MGIGSGQFNKRVIVQQLKTDVEDAYNEVDRSDAANWQTFATRWAYIVPKGGREFRFARKDESDLSHLVQLLSDKTTRQITSQMRLKYGDRFLNIIDCYDVAETRNIMELKCKEVT